MRYLQGIVQQLLNDQDSNVSPSGDCGYPFVHLVYEGRRQTPVCQHELRHLLPFIH
jgi:hypothetical protein